MPLDRHRVASAGAIKETTTNVQYCDVFWALTPYKWALRNTIYLEYKVPVLHRTTPETDLSFLGRGDCGHLQVDVDLKTPFNFVWNLRALILVSLPMVAR